MPGTPERHHVASPNDLVACGAERRSSAGVGWALLGRLQDGAAVLHGRGLDRLLMLRHGGAGLVRVIAVGETGVRYPRGPTGWTGT